MKISVSLLRNLINKHDKDEISISRFAEILNEQASSDIMEALNEEKWVKVSEQMPANMQKIIFYSNRFDKVLTGAYYFQDAFGRRDMFIASDGGHFSLPQVSHWQPLPTPPTQHP